MLFGNSFVEVEICGVDLCDVMWCEVEMGWGSLYIFLIGYDELGLWEVDVGVVEDVCCWSGKKRKMNWEVECIMYVFVLK